MSQAPLSLNPGTLTNLNPGTSTNLNPGTSTNRRPKDHVKFYRECVDFQGLTLLHSAVLLIDEQAISSILKHGGCCAIDVLDRCVILQRS